MSTSSPQTPHNDSPEGRETAHRKPAERAPQYVSVPGNNNNVYTAQGDFNIYNETRSEGFLKIEPPQARLEDPPDTSALEHKLKNQGVLLLGGPYRDKLTIAYQMAACISVNNSINNEMPRQVMEWNQGAGWRNVVHAIERESAPSILLLPNLLPQHIDLEIARIKTSANANHHLVLITTEQPLASWTHLSVDGFWVNLDPRSLFDPDVLDGRLHRLLKQDSHRLPAGAFNDRHGKDEPTLGGVALSDIACRLQDTSDVDFFIQQVVRWDAARAFDSTVVDQLIAKATSLGSQIKTWFHAKLDTDEKILALGLGFFDGFYEDQFFSAMEQWVTHIRAYGNPWQRTFDYEDINSLRHFFNDVGNEIEGRRFKTRGASYQRGVFEAAWSNHRRLLLGALPALVQMAARSVPGRFDSMELYGNDDKCEQIRRNVSDILSCLGRLSVHNVQTALLHLASDKDVRVQSVAARAMAQWRESSASDQLNDMSDRLFEILENWQGNTRLHGTVKAILDNTDPEHTVGPLEHIRATIALTLAYAAGYDKPGALAERVQRLLMQLAVEPNNFVRQRFEGYTLPCVVLKHLAQLRDERLLHQMLICSPRLAVHIGKSLAYAYQDKPHEVMKTLSQMYQESQGPRQKGPPRGLLLRTLAYTYGKIDYGDRGPLSVKAGFEQLRKMLELEREPEVRGAVIYAVFEQSRSRLDVVERFLAELLPEVDSNEQNYLIEYFRDLYLDQRTTQSGFSEWMVIPKDVLGVQGMRVPIWTESARPNLTGVEKVLLCWLRGERTQAAQRFALQAFIEFAAKIDEFEANHIANRRQELTQASQQRQMHLALKPQKSWTPPSWYAGKFVPWLATLGQAKYASILGGLLTESVKQRKIHNRRLEFVLERCASRGDAELNVMIRKLRLAVSIYPVAWGVGVGIAVLLIVLISSLR